MEKICLSFAENIVEEDDNIVEEGDNPVEENDKPIEEIDLPSIINRMPEMESAKKPSILTRFLILHPLLSRAIVGNRYEEEARRFDAAYRDLNSTPAVIEIENDPRKLSFAVKPTTTFITYDLQSKQKYSFRPYGPKEGTFKFALQNASDPNAIIQLFATQNR